MKKVVFAATLAASMALPSIAMAQMMRGDANTGWYAGASVGQSKLKDACSGIGSCDDKDTAWRILGGYQINRNFAAELGYHDLGNRSTNSEPWLTWLSTLIFPPWASTTALTRLKPRPRPRWERLLSPR